MTMLGTDLVSGGWNAAKNLFTTTAGAFTGLFFPTFQRETIQSEITQAAGGTGSTYRPTTTEAQSVWESELWSSGGWVGSPYQNQYAIPVKVQESKQLDQSVSAVRQDPLGSLADALDWAAGAGKKIKTVVDEWGGIFSPRETIKGKPDAGYPEGRNEQHLNDLSTKGADVVKAIKVGYQNVLEQVKGLFNLGFPQQENQKAYETKTGGDYEPPSWWQTEARTGIIIAIIVLIIILSRKK